MKISVFLILLLALSVQVGCVSANQVTQGFAKDDKSNIEDKTNASKNETLFSAAEVTTASGVKLDPAKHRAITFQMW